MRLPLLDDEPAHIDVPEATRMVRYAIDHGVNYIDTAYPYHNQYSEIFVGNVLKDGYREKVKLATKLPTWLIENQEDPDKYLNEQLTKLQTGHIDFYLMHGLNQKSWDKIQHLDVLTWAENAIKDGRIKHLGFSFHDKYEVFKEIVDGTDMWTFCQIQYNYMDINEQAGTRGLRYAASKGLAIVIMEPILGGRLVEPPQSIQDMWDSSEVKRKPADWALQWLWDQPEISVVLSGMSLMQHVEENVTSAASSEIGTMSGDEMSVIDQVRLKYEEICPIKCTSCEYCMPCPNGLNIPDLLRLLNHGIMYDKLATSRKWYLTKPEGEQAGNCQRCYECEAVCPQQLIVSDWMEIVHAVLGEGKPIEEFTFPN
jgi:predicted aldo/keto reductase-like oxidoreductase